MIRNNESISFEDFEKVLNSNSEKNKFLRVGQKLMGYLGEYWIEEYNRISGTELDCFYIDIERRYNNTIEHLKSVWDKRDVEIGNRADFSHDRRRNRVSLTFDTNMTLTEFASYILRCVKFDDLPQLVAILDSMVDNEKLTLPLINHFEYLKNKKYSTNTEVNKPFNLLNYEGY